MKQIFNKILKLFWKSLLTFIGLISFYLLSAWICGKIPVNSTTQQPNEGIEIFLSTSGVHLDIVVPYQNELFDWSKYLYLTDFDKSSIPPKYVAIGWGDKGFFLDTPTWADLKASTAIKALFMPSATAIHVVLKDQKPKTNQSTKSVILSPKQYELLNRELLNAFQLENGKPLPISGNGYAYMTDKFYEAKGSYHLFMTCNEWANCILKKAGLRTALWAPFDWGILQHFE